MAKKVVTSPYVNPRTEETVNAFVSDGKAGYIVEASAQLVPNQVNQDYTLVWWSREPEGDPFMHTGFIDHADLIQVQIIFQQYGQPVIINSDPDEE